SGVAQGDTPRWSKHRLCFVVARSGWGRAPPRNEAKDADNVPTQWRRLFPAMVFVLMCGGIACPFHGIGPWLTLALTHVRGYKFCANCESGSAVCMQGLMVQQCLRSISPHYQDAGGTSPEA